MRERNPVETCTMKHLAFWLLLFVGATATAQSAYERSPVYFELGFGINPWFQPTFAGDFALGYRIDPRWQVGLGYFGFLKRTAEYQIALNGPFVQGTRIFENGTFLSASVALAVEGELTFYDPLIEEASFFINNFPSDDDSFGLLLHYGYRTRSGLGFGGYLHGFFDHQFFSRTSNPTINIYRGALNVGARVHYFFPHHKNR